MDATDFRLLVALFEDARQSYRSLGRRVSLSHPAVLDRLEQLKRRGVFRGFFLTIYPMALGRQDLLVRFDGDWTQDDAERALKAPDVIWVALKLNGNLTVQLWPIDKDKGISGLADALGAKPSGHFLAETNRSFRPPSAVDWQIIDAMVDDPVASLDELVGATGLSPKTVRIHLGRLLAEKTIRISPIIGSLSESGELVYTISVFGPVGLPEIRTLLGEVYLIKQFQHPPAKHLLCRGLNLGEVLEKTKALERLPGVARAYVSLNRDQIIARWTVHKMVRQEVKNLASGLLSAQ